MCLPVYGKFCWNDHDNCRITFASLLFEKPGIITLSNAMNLLSTRCKQIHVLNKATCRSDPDKIVYNLLYRIGKCSIS